MRAASAAWNLLAAELESAASSYQSTINVLADDEWRGPTSASMVAAVDPYVTWMNTTGAQAEHTAAQASAAASAYESAFAMTVPPVRGRGQPRAADGLDRHERPGSEHAGYRGH